MCQQRGDQGRGGPQEASARPSTNVTAPKPVSLASRSVTLSNRSARGVEPIRQPLTRPKLVSTNRARPLASKRRSR